MLYSTLLISAQLSIFALALPAPINDSTTLPDVKKPDSIADNKDLIQALTLAPLEKDRINLIPNDADFVFDFNNPPQSAVASGKGGHLVRADRENFPALIGTGVSMAMGFFGPCGFNTPHSHPRGSEVNAVIKGSLITEFILENGAHSVANKIDTNQMTVYPQGSMHTQFNPSCDDAIFVAGFGSEDPGSQQTAQTFFGLNDDIVEAALAQETFAGADLDKLRSLIPATVAEGVEKCLKQCHISKR